MMIQFETFRPEPSLAIDIHDPAFDEPVDQVNEHLRSIGAEPFIQLANAASEHNGMRYAVVGGGEDRSSEEAILMPGTFANGVWPHILARGEAISHMAAEAGLRDRYGNLVPVVVTGSPSMESSFDLSDKELKATERGDFRPIAERQISLSRALGYGTLRGIVGSSQAAALPSDMVAEAYPFMDVRRLQVVMAEPPHARQYQQLPVPRQLANIMIDGATFKRELKDEAIVVIDEIFASGQASPGFEKGMYKERIENLAIVRGFAKGGLIDDLTELSWRSIPSTVIHGSKSKVSRREDVAETFKLLSELSIPVQPAQLEVVGANHILMDRVGRFATAAAANLTRR